MKRESPISISGRGSTLVEKDGFATENAENNAMKVENKTSDTDSDLEKIVIDSINDILNM